MAVSNGMCVQAASGASAEDLHAVADMALARFSPATQIPTTQLGRDMTRAAACGLLLLLLFIKFVAHVGDFGYGFFVNVILAIVVSTGAWFIAQGKTTPVSSSSP